MPRRQRTHLGHESFLRLPMYDEHGAVLSPTVSLHMALEEGPISEAHLLQLAAEYDDANLVHNTLQRLGCIRVRQDDGTVMVMLSDEPAPNTAIPPGAEHDGSPVPPTRSISANGGSRVTTPEGTATFAVGMGDQRSTALDDYFDAGGDLVPWKEATRAGASIGDLSIVHRGAERFVRKSDLDTFLSNRRRSNAAGAQAKITAKIDEATEQRSQAVEAAARGRQAGREFKRLRSEQIISQTKRIA